MYFWTVYAILRGYIQYMKPWPPLYIITKLSVCSIEKYVQYPEWWTMLYSVYDAKHQTIPLDSVYIACSMWYVCVCSSGMQVTTRELSHTDAWDRSMVSKMRLMTFDIWMISPLIRQSFLLSSNTVFMFSIHSASIGPSNITHFLSGVSADANSRNVLATTPSVHWNKSKTFHTITGILKGLTLE